MRRFAKGVLATILVIAYAVLAVKASVLFVQSGSWSQTGILSNPRVGASAATLPDGRILITGGDPGNGPTASVDLFNTDGTISAAPPMMYARSKQVSVVLQDGRILVAGGITTGGSATNTAEIFDPIAQSWSSVALGMIEARSGATAAVLQDGRVLVAGGQNGTAISSTLEIFDPVANAFSAAGMMSSPRSQHAMAVLPDGRVLIVGGNNGTAPVASTSIFDPVAGTVSAGPALNIARYGHSATTLLNGIVVVIGGNNGNAVPAQMDVTPAELFDPTAGTFTTLATNLTTPREGHLAILLPNNNSILIAGGTSGGTAVASAELFTPQESTQAVWTYGFGPTGAMTTARTGAAGSANQVNVPSTKLQRNGIVAVAGGNDANGNALNTAEAYGYPTVQTDQSDYPPGTTVTITGSGFQAGETVTIQLVESPLIDTHGPYTVQADANGNFTDTSFTTDLHDLAVRFYLTATGGTSGFQAQNTFTDGNAKSGDGTMIVSPTIVAAGSTGNTLSFTFTADNGKDFNAGSQATIAVPTGWTAPTSGNVTVTNGTCTAASLGSISGSTITINMTCPGGDTFTVTYGGVTATSTVGTSTFTTQTKQGSPAGSPANISTSPSVTVQAASKLVFAQQPANTAAGASITPAVTVKVEDANGDLVNTSTASVTIAIGTNPSSGTLSGTLTVNASGGVATFSGLSINNAGTNYALTASSSGLTSATSSAFNITQASTTTTITNATALATATVVGQGYAVQYSVAVNPPGSGTPTGNVTVSDGSASCTATASASSCLLTSTSVGAPKTITATYAGDSNFATSTSAGVSHTVNKASTTTTITNAASLSSTPSVVGQAVTINYSVAVNSPGSGTIPISDNVTVSDGAGDSCTGTVSAGTCSITFATAGTKSLTATYVGDTNFATSTSTPATSHTVNQANTTTALASSANPSVFGQSVTFTATVTVNSPGVGTIPSGETVTFKDNGSMIGTGTTNASGVATFATSSLAVATHPITAVYAGDTNFATSTSTAVSQVVNKASTTTTITNDLSTATVIGQAYSVTVSVTINAPGAGTVPNGDTVTVSDGSATCTVTLNSAAGFCSLTSTTAGNKTITATYNGDANFSTSTSAGVAHTVNKANTTTTITSNTPNPSTVGQSVTINYSVTVNSPGAGTPTGTVTVSDVAGDSCAGTVAAGTCSITFNTAGTKTLTATYAGDTSFNTSASTGISQTVNPKLAFTSTAFAILTGTCSSTISVQIQNANGSAATLATATVLNLSSSTSTGKFFSDAACSTQITTSAIAVGSSTASFFYDDTGIGSPVITAASTGLTSVTQTETVTGLRFGSAAFSVPVNTCSTAISLQSANSQGSGPTSLTQATTINLSSSPASGKFYSDAACTTQITSTTISPAIDAGHDSQNFFYENTTAGSPTLTASAGTASAQQTESVVTPPSISKAFGAAMIPVNGTTSLSFTITNPTANTVALTGVAFTDNLPAGLVVATPNALSSTCGGTTTAAAGSGNVSLSGGTAAVNSSCTISVNVTGTTSGVKNNSVTVHSTNGGTGNTSTASITVASPPTISKAFGASSITLNSSTSLTLTITNANTVGLTGVAFTDNLPAGLAVATPNGLVSTCGGTTTAMAGSGSASLSGGTVAASSSCSISLNVTGTALGAQNNTTGTITSNESGPGTTSNTTTLTVTGTPPTITSVAGTTFTAGVLGSYTVTTTGTPTSSLSESGTLPGTVTFTDNHNGTATLAGTTTSAGSFPIIITAQNGVNPNATQNFTLTVNAAALASITLSPASATITAGGSAAYAATGYDQYGNSRGDVTGATTFTVTNGACTANSCSSTMAGTQTVTGNDSGITNTAALNVMPGAITHLVLTPATVSISAGGSQAYTAQGVDFYGNPAGDVTSSTTFTIAPDGSCTGATCTTNVADVNGSSHTVTGTYTNGAQGTASLMVNAGSFNQLQLLVPGETATPGTVPGKTGTPNIEYVNGPFKVTVNAVDQYWNVINTVTDMVAITSNDSKAMLPANAALVAGTGTFSVTLETVSYNPNITTLTASDVTNNTMTADTSPLLEVVVVYTAAINPTMAGTGDATTYTLTVSNAPAPNTKSLASVKVAVPAADQETITNVSVTATQSGGTTVNWSYDATLLPGTLRFFENTANDAVTPGGTITITFTATTSAPVSGTVVSEVWTTTAFSDAASQNSLPLAGPEPTVKIGQAPAIISASTATFTFGTAGTFTVTSTGFPVPTLSESGALPSGVLFTDNGDGTATLAGTPGAAGNFPITITAHNGFGPDATQSFTLTVNKANATISVTPYHVTYDGMLHTASGTATGVGGVDLSAELNLSGTTHTNAGTYSSDTWTFTDPTGNYNNVGPTTITDQIDQATAAISVTPYHVQYDATAHTAAGTATGVGGVNLGGDLDLSHTTHTNAGTYSSDFWTFTDATGNYKNVAATTITDQIDQATANITVNAYNVTYDDNPHTATGTATGVGGVNLGGDLDLSHTTHTNAGTYSADYWTFTDPTSNYKNVAATNITDQIDKATASISVTPYSVTYDGNAHTATGSATGVGGVDLSSELNLSGTTHTSAGTYTDTWTFTDTTGNYNNANNTVTDVINKATPAVTVTGGTFTYDGNPHIATAMAVGVDGHRAVSGTFAFTYTIGVTVVVAPINAGTYSVSAAFTSADPNYTNSAAMGTIVINQATPAFSNLTNSQTIPYGTSSITLSGLISATVGAVAVYPPTTEYVTITINTVSVNATIGPNGGFSTSFDTHVLMASSTPYTITYSYAGDSNLTAAPNDTSTTLTVNPAATATTVTSSENPSIFGDSVTFTVTVSDTSTSDTAVPTGGTVQFVIDGMNRGAPVGLTNGTATSAAVTNLSAGQHVVTAVFAGDTDFSASTSTFFVQTVNNPLSSIAVTPASSTIVVGQTEQFTATGTFKDGSSAILPPGGTWALGNAMTNPVSAPMTAAGANGQLYFFGGQDTGGAENFVQIYNPATGVWSTGSNSGLTARYGGITVAPGDGKIYVIGGLTGTGTSATSVVEVYDPVANTWTSKAPMPKANGCLVGGAINGQIYVLSGCNGSSYAKELDVYNPATNTWNSSPLAVPTSGHASGVAGVINAQLYVAGGYDTTGAVTGTTESYDPQTNTWKTMTTMPASLAQVAGAVSAQKLYAVGGIDGSSNEQQTVYAYDPSQEGGGSPWTTLSAPLSAGRTNIALAPFDGLLVAAGGSASSPTGLLEILDTDNVTWSSGNATVATIGPNTGLATGVNAGGPINISATSATYSVSGSTQLTVKPADTTSSVMSSLNPSTYGQTVTFTSTVSVNSPGAGTPTGTVTFYDGATVISGVIALSGGTANYMTTATQLAAGNHSITAVYSGDGKFNATGSDAGSTATVFYQTVNKANATINVTPYTVTYDGNPHTATGTATGVSGVDLSSELDLSHTTHTNAGTYNTDYWTFADTTGNYNSVSATTITDCIKKANAVIAVTPYSVTYDGNAHTATGTATGVESPTPANLTAQLNLSGTTHTSAGTYTDTWTFTDTTGNYYNASGTVSDYIAQAPSTTTVSCPTISLTYNGSAQTPCTATVTGAGALNQSLTVSYSNNVNAGTATASATFAGDTNHAGSSGGANFTINQAPSTTTVSCPASVMYNGSAQTPCSATVTGAGALSQMLTISYSNNVNAGAAMASASYAGDANHTGSSSSATFTITPAPTTTIVACPTSLTYNGSAQTPCSASVTGAALIQTLIVAYVNNINAGTAIASASYPGDANHTGSSGSATFMITQASTSTSVSSSPNPSSWGNVVTLTATVTNTSTPAVPTGSVSFYNAATGASCSSPGSSTLLDTEPLVTVTIGSSSNQQASTSTPNLPVGPGNTVGTDTILACYDYNSTDPNFNANFAASYGTTSQTVNPAPIATLTPPSLSFGNQQGGTTSSAQPATLCNGPSGPSNSPCYNAPVATAALSISSINFGGTNSTYFTQTNTCTNTLAVGGSCTINVKFAPPMNAAGIATALLTVTDNNENVFGSTQSTTLTGAGTSSISSVGSLSTYAIFATANGCSTVNVSGNGTVDSFDGSTNAGNVGTNGNVTLSGNPVINGAVYSPVVGTGNCSSKTMTGLSLSGKAQMTGGLKTLSAPVSYPLPPAPNPAPPTTNQNISGSCGSISGCTPGGSKSVSLAPGQYGNLNVSGGTTVHVKTGTYNVNSLTLTGNSILYLDSWPVVINLAGASLNSSSPAMDLSGGSIVNPSGITSTLQFYYAGSSSIKLSGGAGSYALVYAPNAAINVSGGSHFYGSMIGSTINSSGNTAIHYDAALPSINGGNYIWFSSTGLNVQGLPTTGSVKLYVTNATINFTANGTNYVLPVPNAVITFSSTATSASTTWDATSSRWSTLIPMSSINGNATIHSFFDALAFQVPANFPGGIQNATWSAAFSTSTPGVKFNWQWGAAVYSTFAASNTGLTINPLDNSDPAGTPENYKSNLIFGDTGAGYTGLYVGTAGVVPTIAPISVAPSSHDFGTVSHGTPATTAIPIVLTNNDSVSYTISSIQMTGTNPGDFVQTNNCPTSPNALAAGASCTFTVTFTPSASGGTKETAKIVVNDNANNSPQTVFLKGLVQ